MRDLCSVLGWALFNLLSWHLLNTPAHRLARHVTCHAPGCHVSRETLKVPENRMARCSIKPFPDLSIPAEHYMFAII